MQVFTKALERVQREDPPSIYGVVRLDRVDYADHGMAECLLRGHQARSFVHEAIGQIVIELTRLKTMHQDHTIGPLWTSEQKMVRLFQLETLLR